MIACFHSYNIPLVGRGAGVGAFYCPFLTIHFLLPKSPIFESHIFYSYKLVPLIFTFTHIFSDLPYWFLNFQLLAAFLSDKSHFIWLTRIINILIILILEFHLLMILSFTYHRYPGMCQHTHTKKDNTFHNLSCICPSLAIIFLIYFLQFQTPKYLGFHWEIHSIDSRTFHHSSDVLISLLTQFQFHG